VERPKGLQLESLRPLSHRGHSPGPATVPGSRRKQFGCGESVTPGETLGTLYTFGVGSDKTKQHRDTTREREPERERERFIRNNLHNGVVSGLLV